MAFRSMCLIAASLACLCAGSASLAAQARERVAFVTVADRDSGTPRDTVGPADIVVREDGATREVLRVTPATGPFPIAVIVDTSTDAEPAIQDLRTALTAFSRELGALGPLALVGMGARPTVLADYATTPAAFQNAIGRVFAQPMSAATVVDAVDDVARGLGRRESERAAIVVLSTGGREGSNGFYQQALDRLEASGASLHVVMYRPAGRAPFGDEVRQRDTLIDRGVRATGGSRRDVLATQALAPAMAGLARLLAHQFRVVYARPQTLIPPESVTITAASPAAVAYGGPARGQPK